MLQAVPCAAYQIKTINFELSAFFTTNSRQGITEKKQKMHIFLLPNNLASDDLMILLVQNVDKIEMIPYSASFYDVFLQVSSSRHQHMNRLQSKKKQMRGIFKILSEKCSQKHVKTWFWGIYLH